MLVGTSLRSGYPPVDARVGARWMIERARAAAGAGLDSLFVGDHHNVPVPYYQNVAILGRLLAEWDSRPAGALFLLPLWHPVLLAEQIGTLASVAQGPFIMQCAIGGGRDQFEAFGVELRQRPRRFEAALDVVRRLCAGEEVSLDEPWRITNARVAPVPPQRLEIWIGAAAPAAFLIGPEATPAHVPELVTRYRDACARHGAPGTRIAVRRDVHVGADDADAERVGGPVVAGGYRGIDPAALVVGGVNKVADAFAQLGEYGCTDVIVRHLASEQSEVLRSFERLGNVRARLGDTR
jgi:alkanesulfonate monooxygenase SsuD/methylene tetrahydromethanopterin reductase-like flavin-dependent oxidoreductase (luciferase family)